MAPSTRLPKPLLPLPKPPIPPNPPRQPSDIYVRIRALLPIAADVIAGGIDPVDLNDLVYHYAKAAGYDLPEMIDDTAVATLEYIDAVFVLGMTTGLLLDKHVLELPRATRAKKRRPKRRRVMGEIRKRGDVYWIRYYRDGRRFEESARSDKYETARDLLRNKEGDIAKGAPVSSQTGRYRFEDAASDIETEYAVNRRKSIGELQRRIKLHLAPYFGAHRMATITTADVRLFTRKRLEAKASAGEINRELAVLKRMFTLAVKGNKLMVRPYIPMLQEDNVRTGFFEREEFMEVCAKLPAPIQAVVTFAYLTGWRIQSEILPLQWRQVDLQAGTVRLDPGTTKNRDGRLFPFGRRLPELAKVLEAQRVATKTVEAAQDKICPWVFHRNGRRIRGFRTAWANACEAAGVPGRIPHDLRRTAVRNLERAGVSRSVAMQLTGHKTESVYRRYAIVSEGDLGAGLEKLGLLSTGTVSGTVGQKGRVRRFKKA